MNALTSLGYKVNNVEELENYVPAAFSTSYHPDRSDRYSFFSTKEFLSVIEKLGWTPYSGKQQGSGPYARHIIRLVNLELGDISVKGDKIRPNLMIDNSHNGITSGQLHLGLFRLVCSNGLVVGIPGMHTSIKFRHLNLNTTQIMNLVAETAEQYRNVATHITDMQMVEMSEDQKLEFAIKAAALREPTRFLTAEKNINVKKISDVMNPTDLYLPRRDEDMSNDLWSVFNVIQERTVNGLYERKSETGRKGSPKVITNATRSLEYNKKLWTIAEDFMPKESLVLV
jgi:hypothetical protein